MTCYEQVDEVLRESSSAIATIVKALLYEKEKRIAKLERELQAQSGFKEGFQALLRNAKERIAELETREQDAMIFEEHFCEEHRMQCGEMTEHPECIWCRAEKAECERDAAIKEIGVQARKLGYAQADNVKHIADYQSEVDEFNAGCQAAKDGKSEDDEPIEGTHDVWRIGYAWYQYDELKAENAQLREAIVKRGGR